MCHPRQDPAAELPKAEYDRGLWRYRLLFPPPSANAGTPIGGVPFRPFALSLPNSNCRSAGTTSRLPADRTGCQPAPPNSRSISARFIGTNLAAQFGAPSNRIVLFTNPLE